MAVLFAITVLTFLIFQAIPDGDPALRMAGRLATPQQVHDVRVQWGFDKPIYVQYAKTMEKIFDGSVISYSQQTNVEQEIVKDLPPTISLAIGAGIIWLLVGVLFGLLSAVHAGGWLDRALTVVSLTGISMPVFFLGAIMLYWLGYQWHLLPLEGYVPLTSDPWGWFTHHADALGGPVGGLDRCLLAPLESEPARRDERGLRAHRAGQGSLGATRVDQACTTQLH